MPLVGKHPDPDRTRSPPSLLDDLERKLACAQRGHNESPPLVRRVGLVMAPSAERDQQIQVEVGAASRPTLFNFSDEITSPSIGTDKAALRHFHAWLQERNVRPTELGVKALGDVVPIESPQLFVSARSKTRRRPTTPRASDRRQLLSGCRG